jgi:hypothetical protein
MMCANIDTVEQIACTILLVAAVLAGLLIAFVFE